MGYRIQVSFHESDASSAPSALLHANSHHDDIDLDALIQRVVAAEKLPTSILAALLAEVYPSDCGGHKKGAPIFQIDFAPGDAEKRFAIVSDVGEELARNGYVANVGCAVVEAPPFGGLPAVSLVRLVSAPLDTEQMEPLAGVFADGYSDADINRVFGLIRRMTGIELCALWDCFDPSFGFNGPSDFAIRFNGRLHEFTVGEGEADLFSFLSGEGPCPTSLAFDVGKERASVIDSGHNSAMEEV